MTDKSPPGHTPEPTDTPPPEPAWLIPHFDGLRAGQAVARRCTACGHVSLPPMRSCPDGHSDGVWEILGNRATVLHRTGGPEGDVVLARFDGSDTASVMRAALPAGEPTGCLRPTGDAWPALILFPDSAEQE